MKKMKAIVIYEPGRTRVFLFLEERPIPELREGWTLVKVRGFGINHFRNLYTARLAHLVLASLCEFLGIECCWTGG